MPATPKKTLILGASDKPERYSNLAIKRLRAAGHPIVAIGNRQAVVDGVPIEKTTPSLQDVDTVTLYLNPVNQRAYYDYILSLKPRRIIFNPGAENEELEHLASEKGIKTMEACTLVLLTTGQF
jgi:uncharacterized protein